MLPCLCGLALVLSACRDKPPVGFVGHLSGPTSELSIAGRDGAKLFVEQEGFRLVSCDSRGSPAGAAACVRALADSGARVVIGPMISGVVDSAIAAAKSTGVLLVSPTVSSHLLIGLDDPFLRLIGSNLDQADTLAALLRQGGFRHPLVLWERKNAVYTEAVARRVLLKTGVPSDSFPAYSWGYTTGLDLSFDSLVASQPQVDAFLLSGSAMDAGLLCRAVARAGSKAKLFGSQFAMGSDLLRVGGATAEGMVIAAAAPLADSTPQRRAFLTLFEQRFRHPPAFSAYFGWEAAVASRPGWTAPDAAVAKGAILAQARLAPLGDTLELDRFGDTRRRVVPHVVKAGRFEVLR
ncbi:MAG: ABC transporter substrate-binding protein [Fibrobacterota bacterium]|nr:MAG: ABC transporter substrate-binding protein [Fibrobacterota bacterium]